MRAPISRLNSFRSRRFAGTSPARLLKSHGITKEKFLAALAAVRGGQRVTTDSPLVTSWGMSPPSWARRAERRWASSIWTLPRSRAIF